MHRKNSKGTVSVENHDGRVRLRWRYGGQRYALALYAYNRDNINAARRVALQIELDITYGTFDSTLVRYGKVVNRSAPDRSSITPMSLVERFQVWATDYRQKNCEKNIHYNHTRNILKRWGGSVSQSNILKRLNAEKFSPQTYNDRLSILKAFSQWLVKQGVWTDNPFEDVSRKKKVKSAKPERKPFTLAEIERILDAVRTDRFLPSMSHYTHSHYYPFLYFIFKTGVRNAEAVGLRVCHIDFSTSLIHIRETMARTLKGTNPAARVRKETKNGKNRMLPLTNDLKDLLEPVVKDKGGDDLVFQSYSGGPIDDRMFQRRVFSVVLKNLDIPHRVLYACRHTFGSRCINEGLSPVMTAFLMGNNPETALKNYVHQIDLPQVLPTLKRSVPEIGQDVVEPPSTTESA